MENTLVNAITSKDSAWEKRPKYNCAVFIISYIFMGAATGITNDSFVSYLNLTVPNVVKGLAMYGSIATLAMAAILLTVHKIGYKKIIIVAPLVGIAALLTCIFSESKGLILISNIALTIGVGMFDYMYPIMFTSYVPKDKRVTMFSRVMYCNLISQTLLTFLNGKIVVWKFAKSLGIDYNQAALLSEHPEKLTADQLHLYAGSYKFVLYLAIVFIACGLFCVLFLKENPADYRETEEEIKQRKEKGKFDFKILLNKHVVAWVLIFSMSRFGASLVMPYFPIYLNNFLHISRGTVSTILTMQTFAMLLAYFATPHLEKKFGSIVTIAIALISCMPLMLLMANGAMFGSNVAWAVGVILFLRSGIANMSGPIQGALPLTFVPKTLVPTLSSFMMLVYATVGILSGLFTRYFLFRTDAGYGYAYYIAAVLYVCTAVGALIVFKKDFNRGLSEKQMKENETKEEFDEAN
ncbi:MFS transporter [Paraclostridium bifermentans]|uniref:MFS transporter n=1 Tax=Paraclostridium bifermentans TaxID=1490 RepID=UPI00359C4748